MASGSRRAAMDGTRATVPGLGSMQTRVAAPRGRALLAQVPEETARSRTCRRMRKRGGAGTGHGRLPTRRLQRAGAPQNRAARRLRPPGGRAGERSQLGRQHTGPRRGGPLPARRQFGGKIRRFVDLWRRVLRRPGTSRLSARARPREECMRARAALLEMAQCLLHSAREGHRAGAMSSGLRWGTRCGRVGCSDTEGERKRQ
jgi:hypothetical protein